jgi:hypothetical protein
MKVEYQKGTFLSLFLFLRNGKSFVFVRVHIYFEGQRGQPPVPFQGLNLLMDSIVE